jgi:hypothetical protein
MLRWRRSEESFTAGANQKRRRGMKESIFEDRTPEAAARQMAVVLA